MHVADPDLDRLINLVQDALIGIAYVDDNQVCGYPNSAKRYGEPERTEITIEALDQTAAQVTPGQRRLEQEIGRSGWEGYLAQQAARRFRSKTERRLRRQGGPKGPRP